MEEREWGGGLTVTVAKLWSACDRDDAPPRLMELGQATLIPSPPSLSSLFFSWLRRGSTLKAWVE
ncbi:transcriptional repressor LexA [Sesbania bispinosa]|nr:transcriptional repressor LexA [Sesbania bispinosa]